MKHRPALYALIRLHAELAGELKANALEADRLREDVLHVEAVLKLLEPEFNTAAIASRRKNRVNPLFKRGHIFRAALAILRTTDRPLNSDEIATRLLQDRGIVAPTEAQVSRVRNAVHKMLSSHNDVVTGHGGRPQRWSVIAR